MTGSEFKFIWLTTLNISSRWLYKVLAAKEGSRKPSLSLISRNSRKWRKNFAFIPKNVFSLRSVISISLQYDISDDMFFMWNAFVTFYIWRRSYTSLFCFSVIKLVNLLITSLVLLKKQARTLKFPLYWSSISYKSCWWYAVWSRGRSKVNYSYGTNCIIFVIQSTSKNMAILQRYAQFNRLL